MKKFDLIIQESEKAFRQERIRADNLGKAAEKLIGAVAIIIGFHLIEIDQLRLVGKWEQAVHGWFSISALVALAISLFLSLLSMQIWKYYSYPRGTTLIDELRDENISDDGAKIKIARMYLKAHDCNAGINDKRARLILISGIVLISGLLLAVVSYLIEKIYI
jgi:hypothetical protein